MTMAEHRTHKEPRIAGNYRPTLVGSCTLHSRVAILPSNRTFYLRRVQPEDIESLTSPADVDALRRYFARCIRYLEGKKELASLFPVMRAILTRLNDRYAELMGGLDV